MTALIGGFYENESNNSASQANDLEVAQSELLNSVWSRVEGQIGGTDTQDFFRLQLDQMVTDARISLYNLSADLDVQLRNSSGRLLASGTRSNFASELLSIPSLPAGTYYIRVYRGVTSARSMYSAAFSATPSNSPVTPPTPVTPPVLTGDAEPNGSRETAGSVGQLTSGVANNVYGSLTGSDQEDWYRVPVGASGTLQIDLTGMSADLDVDIRDSSGNIVGSSDAALSADEQIRLTGLSAGNYFVRVYRYSDAGSSYRLSALVNEGAPVTPPTPTPPPVVVGVDAEPNNDRLSASPFGTMQSGVTTSVSGSLTSAESYDWFQLNISDTTSMTVELTLRNWQNGRGRLNSCDIVTNVQLCDAAGNVLRDSTPAFGTAPRGGIRRFELSSLSAGTYYLRVFRTRTGMASPYTLTATPRAL
jgi:hypothetical protein